MAEIRLENVSKTWGATSVVEGLSFTAESGEFLVLLGASGCGKSTTLRMIAGLEGVSGGRILIGGHDVTHLEGSRRGLSMVFQSYALFPHLTVAENIVFGLKVRRLPRTDRDARLKRVAAMVGLDHLLSRRPAQLSGGQRQRVALARAIAAEHPICLMDEPLSNLDAKLRHEMRVEIRALQRRLGMTVIYVTHDQIEAMSMADRVVVLHQGRVAQQGTPEEIYARPANAFVARFIGSPPMNLLRLDDGPLGAVIAGDEAARPVLPGAGKDLLLGVRPEHIHLGEGRPAHIVAVDYHGADTVVSASLGGQTVDVRVPGRFAAAPGETIRLSWPSEAVHLFQAADGSRCSQPHRSMTGDRTCSAV